MGNKKSNNRVVNKHILGMINKDILKRFKQNIPPILLGFGLFAALNWQELFTLTFRMVDSEGYKVGETWSGGVFFNWLTISVRMICSDGCWKGVIYSVDDGKLILSILIFVLLAYLVVYIMQYCLRHYRRNGTS